MKDFADALADLIIGIEMPKLDSIMKEVAEKIQGDVVGVTYHLIDAYYADYMPPERAYYIRTEEYKARHNNQRNKKGQFRQKKSKAEYDRGRDRSLATAIKALSASGQPAIGVCRPIDGAIGYQAGVLFDPGYFKNNMQHTYKGFTEWDIAENFLFGQHGNGEAIYFTEPHADKVLRDYINSYKPRFDRHYNNACKKFSKF